MSGPKIIFGERNYVHLLISFTIYMKDTYVVLVVVNIDMITLLAIRLTLLCLIPNMYYQDPVRTPHDPGHSHTCAHSPRHAGNHSYAPHHI